MEMEQENTKYCFNCKKDIVSKNFPIHEVHCKRFVVLCEVCEEPVHRDELEEHHQDYHTETECDLCGETLFKDQVDQHKEDDCPERMVHCNYCDLYVKACEYEEHENPCGSRTDECEKCQKRVMLRYITFHMENECTKTRRSRVNRYRRTTDKDDTSKRPHHPSIPVATTPTVRENMIPKTLQRTSPSLLYSPVERIGQFSPNDDQGDISVTKHHDIAVDSRVDNDPIQPLYDRHDKVIRRRDQTKGCVPTHGHSPTKGRVPTRERDLTDDYELEGTQNDTTMVLDPEWVGTVANVMKDEEELDLLIARNVYQEDLRKKEKELYQFERRELTNGGNDEEVARRLQEEFNHQQQLSLNDAALARTLKDDATVVDTVLTDRDHAHQLYDALEEVPGESEEAARRLQEEFNRQRQLSLNDAALARTLRDDTRVVDTVLTDRDHAHQLYDALEEVPGDNDLLVQQLQEEERFMDDGGTKLSTMMVYDRSEIHRREEKEKMEQIEKDHELAARMQQEEETGGSHHGVEEERPNMVRLEPYEEVPPLSHFRQRLSLHDSDSTPEEDTPFPPVESATLSPPDQGIPCDICGAIVDFDQYQNHLENAHPQFSGYVGQFQSHDSLYHPSSRKEHSPPTYYSSYRDPPSPPSYRNPSPPSYSQPNHPHGIHGYGVSSYQKEEKVSKKDGKVECEYCGFPYPEVVLQGHMTVCDDNPEKNLKSAYRRQQDEDIDTTPAIDCSRGDIGSHGDIGSRGDFGSHGDIGSRGDRTSVPCDNCGLHCPMNEIIKHQITCSFRHSHNDPQVLRDTSSPIVTGQGAIRLPLSSSEEEEFDNTIPCQFCDKLFTFSKITDHQNACRLTGFSIHGNHTFNKQPDVTTNSDAAIVPDKTHLTHDHRETFVTNSRHASNEERLPLTRNTKPLNARHTNTRMSVNSTRPTPLSTSLLPSRLPHRDTSNESMAVEGTRVKQHTRLLTTLEPTSEPTSEQSSISDARARRQKIKSSSKSVIAANFNESSH